MAGLLGNGWDDPQSSAIMALAGGLLQGNFGGGLLGANQAFADAKQNAFKQKYMDMQMSNMQSEMAARNLKLEQDKRQQALIQSLLGGAPSGAGQPAPMGVLGSGSFGVVPPPAGTPAIPQANAGGSRIPNLSFDQLAALKMSGLDLTDLHKYANDPRKLEGGSFYENRVTGKREYIPRLPEGMGPGANGAYGFVPGYQSSVVGLEGDKAAATEGAKAGLDLVKVTGPDGAERYVTRAQAAQAAQPRPMAPAPIPQGNPQGAYVGDPQVVLAAINDIKDPAERTRARQAYEQQYGPLQASPTTAQAAAAAAAKTKAEADARATSEREQGRVKKGDQATEMLSNVWRARVLLESDPTGSLLGAGVDKVMGAGGMSTHSSRNADRLETISGWLVNNVPRMEGPQSNFDLTNYQTMAGRVGDRSYPAAGRLAALDEVERIQRKYAALNGGGQAPQQPQQPSGKVFETMPSAAPYKGKFMTDQTSGKRYQSNGMSWVEVK